MPAFPTFTFDSDDIFIRWGQKYSSDGFNKKSLGFPRGIYKGFEPEADTISPGILLNLKVDPVEGYSLLKVKSETSQHILDVFSEVDIQLDFTGHIFTTPVYVIAKAGFAIGSVSTGEIFTRLTPGDGETEITICSVTRPGQVLIPAFTTVPTDRHLPTAYSGQPFGYLVGGSVEQLRDAVAARAEVIAARTDIDTSTTQIDLDTRLVQDFNTVENRLARSTDLIQGNQESLPVPAGSMTIPNSLTAAGRAFEPVVDLGVGGTPGIGTVGAGVISSTPDNIVLITNPTTGLRYLDTDGTVVYGRFTGPDTVTFYTLKSGVETPYSFPAGPNIDIQTWFPSFMTLGTRRQDATLPLIKAQDSGAPLATETTPGILLFAPDGGTATLTGVQGSDSRIVNVCKTDGSTPFTAVQGYTAAFALSGPNEITHKSYVDSVSITTNASLVSAALGPGFTTISVVFGFTVKAAAATVSLVSEPGSWGSGEGHILSAIRIIAPSTVQVDYTNTSADQTHGVIIMAGG